MQCKNLDVDGYCGKGDVDYDFGGTPCSSQLRCPYNGDVQKCLDDLIYSNEQNSLWKENAATYIMMQEMNDLREMQELFEFKKKYEASQQRETSENRVALTKAEE